MARQHHLPPSAASLTASLRDLGYSLETAVADLIDNSISADATDIQFFCYASGSSPVLVLIDNGRGMTEVELIAAMRHGAADPRNPRGVNDLGRFGLGLKTASFSQCRRLTVISSKQGARSGAEWNLTDVEKEDDWFVSILEPVEIDELPFIEMLGETGTIVMWRDMDRLFEDESGAKRDEIVSGKLAIVERHLSLVFHRFLSGEIKSWGRIQIRINGHNIEAFDPFCRKNSATQILPHETVWIGEVAVQMQPYILPHHSRLTALEYDFYQSRSDFISNQGAYVYRNGRLMAWGDWFRLVPKGEATKLARVQIDFPNSLDEAWTIDIKKSRARPPHPVRERLRQIIDKIANRSVTVHRGRGQKLFQEDAAPMWERYADHGGIRYAVNCEHPLVKAIENLLKLEGRAQLQFLINSIGSSVPVEMIYSDYSTSPRDMASANELDDVDDRLRQLKQILYGEGGGDPDAFRKIVRSTRMFDSQLEMAEKFINKEFI